MAPAPRIVVADDSPFMRSVLGGALSAAGFDVVATAHDGDDALAKALSLAPDLVLLDVMMPRMDGYEVCSRLRADPRSAHIPVIMLTAKSLAADRAMAFTAGADDWVTKPFDPADLVSKVKHHLRLQDARAAVVRGA